MPSNYSRVTDKEVSNLVDHYYHEMRPVNYRKKNGSFVSVASALLISLVSWFWLLKLLGVL